MRAPDNPARVIAASTKSHAVPDDPAGHIESTTTGEADGVKPSKPVKGKGAKKVNFEELKTEIRRAQAGETMAKAHGTSSDDFDPAALLKSLRNGPKMPDTATAGAALRKGIAKLAKAIPSDSVLAATSMEAPVACPKRQYTTGEVQSAAHKALAAGAITGAEAATINTHCALGHQPPPELMQKLTGHVKAKPKLLTKSQVLDTASAMLSAGTLTAADAHEIDRALSFDRPIRDDLMKSIRTAHAGLK